MVMQNSKVSAADGINGRDRVKVPSARDGGVTGIMNPVVMNADKGAGNTERHALSSSAWRFACAFRRKAATDSNPKRPLIPI